MFLVCWGSSEEAAASQISLRLPWGHKTCSSCGCMSPSHVIWFRRLPGGCWCVAVVVVVLVVTSPRHERPDRGPARERSSIIGSGDGAGDGGRRLHVHTQRRTHSGQQTFQPTKNGSRFLLGAACERTHEKQWRAMRLQAWQLCCACENNATQNLPTPGWGHQACENSLLSPCNPTLGPTSIISHGCGVWRDSLPDCRDSSSRRNLTSGALGAFPPSEATLRCTTATTHMWQIANRIAIGNSCCGQKAPKPPPWRNRLAQIRAAI
jgi:hypothetical protein